MVWQARIAGRFSIWFLDQDAARRGLIRGYSPSARSSDIIEDAAEMLASAETYPWFARVATGSNIADGPSRMDFSLMESIPGSRRRCFDWGPWVQ